MNTDMTWETVSHSSEQTEQLAAKLASKLRGGEVIELVSDLGGGKTTFTRGLVRGAGSSDKVASPTFTISRQYEAPGFTIAHFDFYRLEQAGIVSDELAEVVHDPAYVTVVEWGDVVHDVLPADRLTVVIQQIANGDRNISLSYPEAIRYIVEGVSA